MIHFRLPCVCFTTLCDWLRKLAPLSRAMRSTSKASGDLFARFFPRLSTVSCICFEFDWLIALFESVVIGQSKVFVLNWKPLYCVVFQFRERVKEGGVGEEGLELHSIEWSANIGLSHPHNPNPFIFLTQRAILGLPLLLRDSSPKTKSYSKILLKSHQWRHSLNTIPKIKKKYLRGKVVRQKRPRTLGASKFSNLTLTLTLHIATLTLPWSRCRLKAQPNGCNFVQHCWILHVELVCPQCCMILDDVERSLITINRRLQHRPTFLSSQVWTMLHSFSHRIQDWWTHACPLGWALRVSVSMVMTLAYGLYLLRACPREYSSYSMANEQSCESINDERLNTNDLFLNWKNKTVRPGKGRRWSDGEADRPRAIFWLN